MTLARLVGLEDQRGSVAMLGEVPVEAIDRQVELAVGVPADVEVVLVERPVAGLASGTCSRSAAAPGRARSGRDRRCEIVELGKLARADPGVEILREPDERFDSQASAHVDHEAVADIVPEQPLIGLVDLAHLR